MKIEKKHVLTIFFIFSTTFGMNNNHITTHDNENLDNLTIVTNETITEQTFEFEFYPKNHSDLYSLPEKIARISYHLSNSSTIYLSYINIYHRKNRGNGLGKALFTYFIQHVQKKNRAIKKFKWHATALDENYMSQEKLENWYKARGAIKDPFTSDFTLDIQDFKPEQDLSLLLQWEIRESCRIKYKNTIEISSPKSKIAHIHYSLRVNNWRTHEDEDKKKICTITIKKANLLNQRYNDNAEQLEKLIKQEILKHIIEKKWINNYEFKVCSFFKNLKETRKFEYPQNKHKKIEEIFVRSML